MAVDKDYILIVIQARPPVTGQHLFDCAAESIFLTPLHVI